MTLNEIRQSITKQEWKTVFWWTIAVIIITTIPLIYGYFNTPEDKVLSGLRSLTPVDINVYYSYIEQVKDGRYIFVDLFTNEPQTPIVFNIFWLGVGLMGKIFNLNSIITFHLARILLIPIFIFTVYFFISYFFTDKIKRQVSLIFILFSAGIGAILAPALEKIVYEIYGYYHWPLDMWVPEAITFLTLFHMPHFIASLTLIILIFLFILLAWENDNTPLNPLSRGDFPRIPLLRGVRGVSKYELYAGLCALVLFQFHPFHLPTVFGVLGGYFAFLCFINKKILWSKLRPLLILFLFTLPNLIYHLYTLTDPILRQRAMQNVCLTPVWWLTLIGFGFLVPLAIMGICYIFKQKNNDYTQVNKYHFLVSWLVIQTLLIYSPTVLQRRMTEGLHIVLSLLAVIALFGLIKNIQQKHSKNKLDKSILYIYHNKLLLIILFVGLFAYTNLFNIARDIIFYQQENIFFYLPIEKKEAFDWIKNNTDNSAIFIAHTTSSNFIAGQAGRFVFAGHGTESLFFEAKAEKIGWFFATDTNDEGKLKLLKQNNINYIYYSDWERYYTYNDERFNPDQKNYLELVYNNDLVQIYKVK